LVIFLGEETDHPVLLSCFLQWPVQRTRYAAAVSCSCCISSTSLFKERYWNERNYI